MIELWQPETSTEHDLVGKRTSLVVISYAGSSFYQYIYVQHVQTEGSMISPEKRSIDSTTFIFYQRLFVPLALHPVLKVLGLFSQCKLRCEKEKSHIGKDIQQYKKHKLHGGLLLINYTDVFYQSLFRIKP